MFFGCSRKLYNLYLEWWNCERKLAREECRPIAHIPNYTYFTNREEYDYFKKCDSNTLSTAKLNFSKAVQDYFNSLKTKKKERKIGTPKFKKKGECKDSYTTYNPRKREVFDVYGKHIKVPKLGFVKIKLHRKFDGFVKSMKENGGNQSRFHPFYFTKAQVRWQRPTHQ